ncbi:MAG: tRNA uridine-5-carboxymethylaminomethyl(34) synthesis GTPase MnmE, partial [Bacteroidota bacterium]|nr:tRNA uridine-5-carboxymethylaminomethyl(34) synthesis GTPase MnmE [Bacteroidota bacterium]
GASTAMTQIPGHADAGQESIAAIATPPGTAGIAVLRISGAGAIDIAASLFDGTDLRSAPTHTVHHGFVRDREGGLLDEVLVTVFRAPRSYTGEDSVEISCHGGSVVSKRVLQRVLDEGVRHAEPGEFTRRAFLNGKMDLSQAEAVADLIHAQTDEAHRASLQQLEGRLSRYVSDIRDRLMHAAGMLELSLDFVEDDVEFLSAAEIAELLAEAERQLRRALDSYAEGRIIRDGARIALVGAPNVGKSSLLNHFLGMRRAIVTDLPGTTRDYIEEAVLLHGEYVRLIDTAGLRSSEDVIEQEGIAISRETLRSADIVCLLADARQGYDGCASMHAQLAEESDRGEVLLVFNKSDLMEPATAAALESHGAVISVLRGDGLAQLSLRLAALARDLRGGSEQGSVLVTNVRHADCLRRGIAALEQARDAASAGMTEEVLAAELRRSIDALGEIIGAVTTDDILNSIFSRFCIGK